jgi:hypothetical protein
MDKIKRFKFRDLNKFDKDEWPTFGIVMLGLYENHINEIVTMRYSSTHSKPNVPVWSWKGYCWLEKWLIPVGEQLEFDFT